MPTNDPPLFLFLFFSFVFVFLVIVDIQMPQARKTRHICMCILYVTLCYGNG